MGGGIYGLLGGILLASALTYQTGEYITKNQRFVSGQLRASNRIIKNRILSDKDILKENEPLDKSINVTSRVSVLETSKDIWNAEVIGMVNWLYSINWYQWGMYTDEKVHEWVDKVAHSISEKK
ncbi:uncharacterized protein PRCAT00002077001 [Priceomyces carsonii]|uniref:uncharacterized protein n=1 Tax=Priceomyces carsonii TaxID=28549 RepID=UPI002ED8B1F8|nr:unnamed protein product [Priceomyces carsonii]